MRDLEMNQNQNGETSPADEQAQTDQMMQGVDSFDVDFDPPGTLVDPPHS
jgi:hypothetical protein